MRVCCRDSRAACPELAKLTLLGRLAIADEVIQ
jgi:hypothetical protein